MTDIFSCSSCDDHDCFYVKTDEMSSGIWIGRVVCMNCGNLGPITYQKTRDESYDESTFRWNQSDCSVD